VFNVYHHDVSPIPHTIRKKMCSKSWSSRPVKLMVMKRE